MDKFMDFLNTKNGRITIFSVLGAVLLLLIIGIAMPKQINVYNFNGNDCVNNPKSAKKSVKNKKEKKQ